MFYELMCGELLITFKIQNDAYFAALAALFMITVKNSCYLQLRKFVDSSVTCWNNL